MKLRLFAIIGLMFLNFSPALAQDQVLAQSQGYQLKESDLVPAIYFLNFLVQGQISQQEMVYLAQSSATEFQQNPAAFMNELQTLNQSIARAQTVTDPLKLGEFRQTIIGEFFAAAQNVPQQQMPAMLQVLFKNAPVLAFDPNTKVALTTQDLQASMLYLQELYSYQGQNLDQQQVNQMAYQLAQNFQQLDRPTQNFLASGCVVLAVFRANIAKMNQAQQQALAQSYQQQNANYQPSYQPQQAYQPSTSAAGKQWENWHNQQSMQIMQDTMNQNHVTMMNVIENMGGSDNYWTLEPVNY
jgi:hypothetical protein